MKKTRKQKPEISTKEKIWKAYYTSMFFLGLILIFFEIFIYRQTIIDIYIPISIIIFTGLITFLLNKKHYKNIYNLSGNFYPIMQNIISWGFITCYIFMATNFYFADDTIVEHKFKIEEKNSMPGSKRHRDERKPLIIINYFGFKKELVFDNEDTEKVKFADSTKVFVRKGGLGFDLLDNYDVY